MKKKEKPEFGQSVLDVARVARVVKGGRRFRFRVALVIGNKKGRIGVGVGKGPDVSAAMDKAYDKAKKNMVNITIVDSTIPHEITVKYGASTVFLKPARKGTGIIAGSAVRSVIELSGIRNIFGKIHGSTNKINSAKAVMLGLTSQRDIATVALERGIDIARLTPRVKKPSEQIAVVETPVETMESKKSARAKKSSSKNS